MAYVNVAEWKTVQVCEWLKGLDNSVLPYVHSFTNNKVNGQQLLNLRPEDLEQLGVIKLGHQEIIIEAVEYLRNFHYELDRENLQLLALRLSCQAHSLHNELFRQTDSKPLKTQTLSDVVGVMKTVKPLVRWLDRSPFSGQLEYNDKKSKLLKLSIEIATCAQRDRFAEKPIEEIRNSCGELAKLADYIIQDMTDPMILQPASLDLATLKKRPGDELGFYILPSFHGSHQIAEIKFSSPAHQCGKMEDGDEIVQVNYQTVVGWERKNVVELFNESPAEVLLTLKRRPRHTKVYGQIYIKPYRLPSNKKTCYTTRWQHNLPSPRPELLTIPDFSMPLPRNDATPKDPSPEPKNIINTASMLDTMATDSSESDSEVEPALSTRLYASKPRSLVQRRATITGASPTTKHAVDIELFWRELKQEHNTTFQLRDKAASCAHGLDSVPTSSLRPQTCLGIEPTKRKKKYDETNDDNKKIQLPKKLCSNESDPLATTTTNNSDINVPWKPSKEISTNNTSSTSTSSSNSNNYNNIIQDFKILTINNNDSESHNDKNYSTLVDTTTNATITTTTTTTTTSCSDISVDDSTTFSCSTLNKTDPINLSEQLLSDPDWEKENLQNITNNKMDSIDNDNETINDENLNNESRAKITTPTTSLNDNTIDRENNNNNNKFVPIENNNYNNNNDSDYELSASNNLNGKVMESIIKLSDNCSISRESSQDKSESASSYLEEGIYSSNSSHSSNYDSKILKSNFEDESICSIKSDKVIAEAETESLKNNDTDQLASIQVPLKSSSSNTTLNHKVPEELDSNIINKVRQTPPEPPPRKYFNKISPSNSNFISYNNSQVNIMKPKVPDRPDIKRDFNSETNFLPHTYNKQRRDCTTYEGYRNFVEKSTDFIDTELSTASESSTNNSQVYDKNYKQDKFNFEKYQLFSDKFSNSSLSDINNIHRVESVTTAVDLPDGATCSHHSQFLDNSKTRTLEKDKNNEKGVVNRAMMVARSIGLHSGSKICSSSPKSSRKRNILLAKRRNVSVKDIGIGDLEGWLTHRSRGAGGAWARSWFILKGSSLYRFKNQDSLKSDCLIVLNGFTASQASEVKSRKYSFKVYHTGTVFYFAADTDDYLSLWLDSINRATLGADTHNRTSGLFSETDESDTESKIKTKDTSLPLDHSKIHFGSLKKIGRKDSNSSNKNNNNQETSGASLDRKYLRFLGARTQNLPVPTAQFRSYRRVLPSSTPNKKQQQSAQSCLDSRVTVAGSSTFYGLSCSQSPVNVPNTPSSSNNSSYCQDMGDYRQTSERSYLTVTRNRPDDIRGFVTLEEFMLSHQNENNHHLSNNNNNRSTSPRSISSTHDYLNHHSNGHSYGFSSNGFATNGMIYGHPRNGHESPVNASRHCYNYTTHTSDEKSIPEHQVDINNGARFSHDVNNLTSSDEYSLRPSPLPRKLNEFIPNSSTNASCKIEKKVQQENVVYYPNKSNDSSSSYGRKNNNNKSSESGYSRDLNTTAMAKTARSHNDNGSSTPENLIKKKFSSLNRNNDSSSNVSQPVSRVFVRDNNNSCYSGSSGDLSYCTPSSETFERVRKETSVSRKASFNLNDKRHDNYSPSSFCSDKYWIVDSLKRSDSNKKTTTTSASEISRLKNVAQYQPPPIPTSPFEQDGMKAAFEMHLDKEHVQKATSTSRLKSFFGSKNLQKPTTLDVSKEPQKTLLGSPRLHRALFREKNTNHRQMIGKLHGSNSGHGDCAQGFSYNGQSYNHQNINSASSINDWRPDTPTSCYNTEECSSNHPLCQKLSSNSSSNDVNSTMILPPVLPYIPPPTSPPPPDDYPGLEYPPVFEPGTYTLSDASLLRTRSNKSRRGSNQHPKESF
ncbi:probable serine/threonine-protein kinase DDB_G0282963 [Microplitis mediator]|uniref:probable serine/threonine-protein kinase DDB_G0282963 n=1 Tax=Microplitis mediator TaxID=375433 RepID=UPI0025566AEA|nr:probable serine/threonine-protein kinase DDB_G0282963 [Microplitis mediator]XP_057326648.1 probable serine/threonine-protein kinase DDB_G0282963 [Microplitis mediator]XP_057326649.1 probable serine/threonine-protein kinase DDB_G0282963 [Microplitis mediator]XP_057326650.1 probable serine/threonine-protein kinase DDB_G0282963 [Microplitis mediator]